MGNRRGDVGSARDDIGLVGGLTSLLNHCRSRGKSLISAGYETA
jgi:hypothetical protein